MPGSVSRRGSAGFSVRDTLFLLSLDLRTNWDEPDPIIRVGAWRAWWQYERADREVLTILQALASTVPPSLESSDAG